MSASSQPPSTCGDPVTNFDFLGITLHFYNNEFELKNHTIRFEELNGKNSYSGDVLYKFLMKVLKKYGIDNRIKSITMDNAAPMTVMRGKYREWWRSQEAEFDGDTQCMDHVMNLSAVACFNTSSPMERCRKKLDITMEELQS